MIGRRTLLLTLALVAPALAGDEAAPKLVLIASQERYAYGEIPALGLVFHNGTSAPLDVVAPCDGSQHGLRLPSYVWTLERVDGQPVTRAMLGLCGTVNPLRLEDFHRVEPDQELAIPVGAGWLGLPGDATTWLDPGRYRVQLTYTFDPTQPDRCYGNGNTPPEAIAARIAGCAALTLTTAPVEFEIAPPSAEQARRVDAWRELAEAEQASEADARAALGEPDEITPHGELQSLRYHVGELRLCVLVTGGAVCGLRAECAR